MWAALNLLEEDFEIQKYNLQGFPPEKPIEPDFILGWGGFNSPVDKWLSERTQKKGLCIGGNAFPYHEGYDCVFYETEWVKNFLQLPSDKSFHAFGVNTDIFNTINIPTPIVWDYIGVGSFSDWKRWEKMKDKQGSRLVVGEYQKDNPDESGAIAKNLLSYGVMVSNMVSPYDLANYYHWSRTLYMPSTVMGGGERSVLEARSCGLKVETEDDNPKLRELLTSPIWDEKYYAEQLKKGILSVL